MANWTLYDNFRLRQLNGNALNLDAAGDTVKVALITAAAAPTTATDLTFAGASYVEVTGTNYSAGGISIVAGQSVALAAGVVTYKSSTTLSWLQNAGGFATARYAVMYGSVSGRLIAWADLGGNVGNQAGDLSITGPATAIFTSP